MSETNATTPGGDTPDNAARMMALFSGREDAYGTLIGAPTRPPGSLKVEIKPVARTRREPIGVANWEAHLSGERPLGVIPIRQNGTCVWGSLDYDVYDQDATEVVRRVLDLNLPLVPCRSKSGGLHLWLFLLEPSPAGEVIAALEAARDVLQLPHEKTDIFPRQDEIHDDARGVGNWILMPYFGDDYGGLIARQNGVKRTGAEMELEEFLRLAERSRVTLTNFRAQLSAVAPAPGNLRVIHGGKGKPKGRPADDLPSNDGSPLADGPPCLQRLALQGGPGEGGRNVFLLNVGTYLKRVYPNDWERQLERANHEWMRPSLLAEEVADVKRSLKRKDYRYQCRNEPLCSNCDSRVCRQRPFGVGGGDGYPIFVGWRKVEDDVAPRWFVKLLGCERELRVLEITDLRNYIRFSNLCASQLDLHYLAMKQADWLQYLNETTHLLVVERAEADVTEEGQFAEVLEEFLVNSNSGHDLDVVAAGRPFEDEEAAVFKFRMRDVQERCERAGMRNLKRHLIERWVVRMGGSRVSASPTNVKGRYFRLWQLPIAAIRKGEREPLSTPPTPRSPV